MNTSVMIPAAIVFFWAGFVSSISFLEAWLKFRVPGVTLPIGLSIGSKVFTVLNRVEWVFYLSFVITLVWTYKLNSGLLISILIISLVVLLAQTFLFLPQLVERSARIINGETVEKSLVHLYYIIAESTKVIILIYLGFHISNQYSVINS